MQRVFRLVDTSDLEPVGTKTTSGFVNSVRDNGVIAPILVAEVPDTDGVISLRIVDGNRRVRAAQAAGLSKVPAVVLKETTPEDHARLTLICNHLRSFNFYTESLAATSLSDDARDIERKAKAMGMSASRVVGMVRKLERMPAPVRSAMYEERIQVSSATDVAGFPPGLQDEVVARLEQRGWLDTRTVATMKQDWEVRHGPINPRTAKRAHQVPPPPPDNWADAPPVAMDDSEPGAAMNGWQVRPVGAAVQPPSSTGSDQDAGTAPTLARPRVTEMRRAGDMPGKSGYEPNVSASRPSVRSEPAIDVEMEAFVKLLDATLGDLAREGQRLGISRSVWVDRAMRAWVAIDPEE